MREAVAEALAAGTGSLPNRALLALRAEAPAWHGGVLGWQLRLLVRGWWTALRARWAAARRFDLRLALARWHAGPDQAALAQLDGLWLRYDPAGMALLAACPDGGAPHAAPVADLAELGELLVAAQQADPPRPPWTCPTGCPARTPAAAGVTALDTRRAR
jgi:hypothetical protein